MFKKLRWLHPINYSQSDDVSDSDIKYMRAMLNFLLLALPKSVNERLPPSFKTNNPCILTAFNTKTGKTFFTTIAALSIRVNVANIDFYVWPKRFPFWPALQTRSSRSFHVLYNWKSVLFETRLYQRNASRWQAQFMHFSCLFYKSVWKWHRFGRQEQSDRVIRCVALSLIQPSN